jgi:hypothetical protein
VPDSRASNTEKETSRGIREIKEMLDSRREIGNTRKAKGILELHPDNAFKSSAARAALSLSGTGVVFISPPVRRLCSDKKLAQA